ncbi:hypothetical protein TNCV_3774381 [Trichonephila clavipes]|nr:hypothetical protein TNCV_3774381 [Trichonephila clavipes]
MVAECEQQVVTIVIAAATVCCTFSRQRWQKRCVSSNVFWTPEKSLLRMNQMRLIFFFLDLYGEDLQRFPRKEQAELRIQTYNFIRNAELRMIQSDASPACWTPKK